jgi:hypothetical protein
MILSAGAAAPPQFRTQPLSATGAPAPRVS